MTVLAQSAGNTGMAFLKIGAGARNIALGDNGTVYATDASCVFYNPANLSYSASDGVFLMHNQWIQDVSSEMIAARITIWGLPVGFAANTTAIKDIEIRSKPGAKEGTFTANYFMGSVSTGFEVADDIAVGITGKYLHEGIYTDESNGYAADLGFTWKKFYRDFSLGFALKNLGSMDTLYNDETVLPSEMRIGVIYPNAFVAKNICVQAAVEFQKYFKTDNSHINIGLEGKYDDVFALRVGYMTGYEAKSFTTGIGVHYKNIDFDYAFVPFQYDMGSANTFSLHIGF